MRPLTEEIPDYLKAYIVQQDRSLYTPMDHASWRYILKIARVFFAKHAHQMYLDGLRQTGISSERIPLIEEMDRCLKNFGWRAVAVSGFIPPAVFMEFLSRGILPIACDMRKIENLAYTPAPDIVHEAAGHAPIIADPEYADYLRHYGELAEKAIFSHHDLEVYEAIRALSDIKEDPSSSDEVISRAQQRLDKAVAAVEYVSEATELARMSWWTIEYGLIGPMENPKIYGAGLLSSVGESYNCLKPEIKKIPFSVDCLKWSYDITKPQPQLFVARDFPALKDALDELAATMAFRQGGEAALRKAKKARTTTTTVLDSGLQISGTLAEYRSRGNESYFLKYTGPVQLSYQDAELTGQGADYHVQGYSTPLGRVKELGRTADALNRADLEALGFKAGQHGKMTFESGITLEGVWSSSVEKNGRFLVLAFTDCTVRSGDEILFQPDWGAFDLACGGKVVSVFGHAADRRRYLMAAGGFDQPSGRPKTNLTDENRGLNELYAEVRKIRESGQPRAADLERIDTLLNQCYPDDWLLRYELLELNSELRLNAPWATGALERLRAIASRSPKQVAETIGRGLELL